MKRWVSMLAALVMVASLALFSSGGAVARDTDHGRGRGHRDDDRLSAMLKGTNEVPEADPDGKGRARFKFDVEDSEVCFTVFFFRTGTPNRGHIHVGDAGVNGGIVVPLFELASLPADERNDALERGYLRDCVDADPAVLEEIEANPDGYYCNLHNARFPGGAIRGQLRGHRDDDD
jgi:hypothetical protein